MVVERIGNEKEMSRVFGSGENEVLSVMPQFDPVTGRATLKTLRMEVVDENTVVTTSRIALEGTGMHFDLPGETLREGEINTIGHGVKWTDGRAS